jgi:aconitase A
VIAVFDDSITTDHISPAETIQEKSPAGAYAVSLSATLYKLPGVADAKLDVESGKAVVSYDPATQNVTALEKAIIGAGFHINSEPCS